MFNVISAFLTACHCLMNCKIYVYIMLLIVISELEKSRNFVEPKEWSLQTVHWEWALVNHHVRNVYHR